MTRILVCLASALAFLCAAPMLNRLAPPPSAADSLSELPFESVLAKFLELVSIATPGLITVALVAFILAVAIGSPFGGEYTPLTDNVRGTGEPGLRAILRRVREWLAQQQLPVIAGPLVESIGNLCAEIDRQLAGREPSSIARAVAALQKLLAVELATLVLHYHRVPRAWRLVPVLNASPNELLLSGLRGVEAQLRTIHEELTRNDVYDLEAQSRYLVSASNLETANIFAPAPSISLAPTPPSDAVGHTLIFGTTASGKTALANHPAEPAAPHFCSWPKNDARTRHEEPRSDSGLSLLEAVGVAAATTAVLEVLRDDDEQPAAKETYTGDGGSFGGAGASGGWSDEDSAVSRAVEESSEAVDPDDDRSTFSEAEL